jgi:quercetin dioxygenase-like cupin family protein
MMTKIWIAVLALAVGVAVGWTAATTLEAQQTGIKRTLLLKTELAGIDGREVYLGTAEIAPGASAGRHFHDGHEIGYVLDGMALFEVEGQAPVTLKPGDHYHVDAGKRHDARNTGPGPAKVLAIYLIEKGKPLAVAAP